ncbi:hypothetical protein BC835DRAFT_650354 [Cytidiella melzeri]|nr:hypothetical protein BC835DRAFT_650354 [Cytidiella melzeri]
MYWFDDTMAKNPSKQMSPSIADTGDTDSNLPATSKRHPVPEPANRNHKCMRGTELAVTGNLDGSNLTLFYQDREGYLCCRFAKNWIWAEPVRVVKAVRDENYVINEYRISKEKLTPDAANLADPRALTSLAAVYWRSGETHKIEVRVYFQVGQSGIHEICFISKVQKWQECVPLNNCWSCSVILMDVMA